MSTSSQKPKFFSTPDALRKWFERYGTSTDELWIGFYNAASGKGGLTYKQVLDEALCYGWIDGVRKKVDDASYTNRFTPRRAKSNWSSVNVKRALELNALGRMAAPGIAAFEKRGEARPQASYAAHARVLEPSLEKMIRANQRAWEFLQSQPPSTYRLILGWIQGAKQEETRLRRAQNFIDRAVKGLLPSAFPQKSPKKI